MRVNDTRYYIVALDIFQCTACPRNAQWRQSNTLLLDIPAWCALFDEQRMPDDNDYPVIIGGTTPHMTMSFMQALGLRRLSPAANSIVLPRVYFAEGIRPLAIEFAREQASHRRIDEATRFVGVGALTFAMQPIMGVSSLHPVAKIAATACYVVTIFALDRAIVLRRARCTARRLFDTAPSMTNMAHFTVRLSLDANILSALWKRQPWYSQPLYVNSAVPIHETSSQLLALLMEREEMKS
jgi:hypothetical protein